MSIYHIADTHADFPPAPLRAARDAAGAARTALVIAACAVRAAIVRRRTERRLARLSDHMLRDFGFEREWDGTIRSLREAD